MRTLRSPSQRALRGIWSAEVEEIYAGTAERQHSIVFQKEGSLPTGKAFYELPRHEEYLPFEVDKHGRVQRKQDPVKTPFGNEWVLEFKKEVKQKYPRLEFKKRV